MDYEKTLHDRASLVICSKPIYHFAARNTLKTFPLTATGWELQTT